MRREILIVGRGGQGILLLGRIIGYTASKYLNYYTSGSEHYTSETRGGESRVELAIAEREDEIYEFTSVTDPYIIMVLYPYRIEEYLKTAKKNTFVFVDRSFYAKEITGDFKLYHYDYTKIAEEKTGSSRVANILMLGHVIKATSILPYDAVRKTLTELLDKRYHEINLKALEIGYNLPA
ncbi:2-oxoacid:acceptor oxidoreductase family protein [Thermogladius sp. 4427co]|uniref:2-oxoacid:acceptor oxidoreductase family protein n=1 Tax=Thermogladius sp. 4427co TaxID=3450718 RepID=UPI003F7A5270